ncbi:MAG: hypothetical protein JWR37_1784 [Mycobacterium sp.]|jgi:ketosteroid isomerase-like protein|nr:hypothetical protein [Mycobacterium sp.]
MSREQNIETTKRGYAAYAAGDAEAALSAFDDNVEWTTPGNSTMSGTYHGKGELSQMLMKLAEKSAKVALNSVIGDGDVVVAFTQVTVGGETADEADVFMFRDGRIVKAQTFGDTALQERVWGTKAEHSAGLNA